MAGQRKPGEKDMSELEKLGMSRSLIEELSASEAKELLRALRLALQRYREARETDPPAPPA